MVILSELNDIQLRTTKVCNYDEIEFGYNVKWNKFICTYKFFQVNECGRYKKESENHYGAQYFYLPDSMVNASWLP